jgi:hypothetical protein
MTRHEQIESISKKLETLDSEVLESLIKLLGRVQSQAPAQDNPTEVMDDETRAWHDADVSKLADYEPYDWGDIDPLTIGEPLRLRNQ